MFDQCSTIQKEVNQSIQDLIKSYKQYSEEEHVSSDARAKANDAEAKYVSKNSFFDGVVFLELLLIILS